MTEAKILTRREFTLAAAMATLSGVVITISACGGGGSSSPTAPSGSPTAPTAAGDKSGVIGDNHSHSAVITGAMLTGGGAISLNIRGASDHPHTVALSAADMAAIAGNSRVSRVSSNDDGHTHSVTFN